MAKFKVEWLAEHVETEILTFTKKAHDNSWGNICLFVYGNDSDDFICSFFCEETADSVKKLGHLENLVLENGPM